MINRIQKVALYLILAVASTAASQNQLSAQSIIEDDFESYCTHLTKWAIWQSIPCRNNRSDDYVRSGNYSRKLTVRTGDHAQIGSYDNATERNELLERTDFQLEEPYYYGFSFYVPSNFPIRDVRLIVGQWKQRTLRLLAKNSPVVAQRFRNGKFEITIQQNDDREYLYTEGSATQPALIGQWTDMLYYIKASKTDNGELRVWKNGTLIIDYNGPLGYTQPGDLDCGYFRMGLYRDTMPEDMTIYWDYFFRVGN